jgi:cytochrome P450
MDAPMLLRYRDIREALTTPQVGAIGAGILELVGWTSGPLVDALRTWLVTLDPPDHDRLRRLVSQPFTPRQVEAVRATTATTARHLSAQLAEAGSADLYQAFAEPLPLAALCDVLGVPRADHSVMAGWIQPIAAALGTPTAEMRSAGDEAMTTFSAYVTAMIDERRARRGDDLLSRLIEAEEAGDRLMQRGAEFDVAQPSPTHLSFSWGTHFCLGAAIARMEAAVALECLLDTFPLIEFGGDPPDWVPYSALRSLDRLPIRVRAA